MKKEKRRTRYQADKEKVAEDQPSEALNQSNNRTLQNDDTFPTTSSTATGTQDNEKIALDNSLQTAVREDNQPIYVTADMPGCSHWRTVDRIPTETNQDNQECDTNPTEVCSSTHSVLDKSTLRRKKKAEWCRKKYHSSKVYREKQKRNAILWVHQHYKNQEIKALNQAISTYKRKLLERSKDLYRKNKRHRNKKKEQSITKYADNEEHRDRVKEQSITKYADNEEHRDRVKEQSITKYADNEEHRDRVKEQSITKYADNEEHRDRVKEQSITKYADNEEHRDRVKTKHHKVR